MATTTRPRTRSRGPGRSQLVEREWELTTLEQCVDSAGAGVGCTVFVEAPAGAGKSRLLTAAGGMAQEANMRILAAAGSQLEQEFPFGLALQLLEPLWLAASPKLREELLEGPAQLAAALLHEKHVEGPPDANEQQYPVIHGLFWATRNLVRSLSDGEADGLAMIVDDGHWADALSLRFLAYLAERADELPIAIILAARAGEPVADSQALATLRRTAGGGRLRPAGLSEHGVTELVHRRFPEAESQFCAACTSVTAGNPFLVTELLAHLAKDGQDPTACSAAMLSEVVPEKVLHSVTARLQAMADDARSVAHSVAVFGEGATVRQLVRLTELDSNTVLGAADELAAVHLLNPGIPLSFAQPLIGSAVLASLPPFQRARAHLSAARILTEEHADADQIAGQLLNAPADDDPAAIELLREAARLALVDGDAERAVALLVRALAENPGPELRVELLAELGRAEGRAGHPQASDRLGEARRISEDPGRRAELALDQGQALYAEGRYLNAADVLASGASELGDADPKLGSELTTAYMSAVSLVGELGPQALQLRERLLTGLSGPPSPLQRAAIAHTLVHDSMLGAPRAQIKKLADLAWGGGVLLQTGGALDLSAPLLCAALVFADELEQAVEIGDTVLTASTPAQMSAVQEIVSCMRAWALYQQGRLAEAEAGAHAALDGPSGAQAGFAQSAGAVIASCQIELGHLDQAESALAQFERRGIADSVSHAIHLDVRAQLRLAQHRPQDALQDAFQAGRVINARFPNASPGAIPWRSTAALAHLALGEPEPAQALVEQELAQARKLGLTRIVIRDLRILGLVLNGNGIDKLAEAVQTGDSDPSRLEHIRALVDYGASLRRHNRRADAREPLRRGLDLSHKAGASVLESRAKTELIATGARPRRPTASGLDSLTVSQRRVAELAARGLTTRQIAEALFVTPKTVEFHLRQTYLKLDVASRAQLTETLHPVSSAADSARDLGPYPGGRDRRAPGRRDRRRAPPRR